MKNQVKKPHLIFLDATTVDLGDLSLSSLKKQGRYQSFDLLPDSQITRKAQTAEILITNKCVLDRKKILTMPKLKLICVAATGVNNVDLKTCEEQKIAVCNVAGYSTQTVAEHALLFLLALAHRLEEHNTISKNGQWSRSPHFSFLDYPFCDLNGKTLGLVGYGTIGKKVAELAKAFGMNVIVAKIPGRKYESRNKRIPLKSVLKQSDYISLHTSLHSNTFHLIGKKELALMKRNACLINLARGPVVNEKELVTALAKNKIRAYASDVMEQEPPSTRNPLLSRKLAHKVLLTPHIAWASRESRQRLVNEIGLNIEAFLKGKKRNRVI